MKNFTKGGRPGKKQKGRPRHSTAGKLTLAVVTCVNLGLGLALSILNRREVIHAVQEDEDVKVLLTSQKKTKAK